MKKNSRLVYSTDQGRIQSTHDSQTPKPQGDGVARVHRQIKGRNGKPATVIEGLPMEGSELKALAKKLKQHCGVGGTVKDGNIEIQGDQREKILAYFEQHKISAKRGGG